MGASGGPGFLDTLAVTYSWANDHAEWIFLLGMVVVLIVQRRLWSKDKSLLLQVMDAHAPPQLKDWPQLPLVSVLVAAWNEAQHIEAHIQSFLYLNYPNKELVLVAGGEDGTYSLAEPHASDIVHLLEQHRGEGKQIALRRGFEITSGEIIYLTDADCLLNSNSFVRLIYPLVVKQETVSSGISKPFREQVSLPFVFFQWANDQYSIFMETSEYVKGLLGRNCALRREVINFAWKENLLVNTGTDYFLALKIHEMGNQIKLIKESIVETSFPEKPKKYIQQRARWVKNLIILGSKYHDWYHVRSGMTSAISGLGLLAMPILPIIFGKIGFVVWFISWGSVLANRYRYLKIANIKWKWNLWITLTTLFEVMICDFIAWSRVLIDISFPNRRARW